MLPWWPLSLPLPASPPPAGALGVLPSCRLTACPFHEHAARSSQMKPLSHCCAKGKPPSNADQACKGWLAKIFPGACKVVLSKRSASPVNSSTAKATIAVRTTVPIPVLSYDPKVQSIFFFTKLRRIVSTICSAVHLVCSNNSSCYRCRSRNPRRSPHSPCA